MNIFSNELKEYATYTLLHRPEAKRKNRRSLSFIFPAGAWIAVLLPLLCIAADVRAGLALTVPFVALIVLACFEKGRYERALLLDGAFLCSLAANLSFMVRYASRELYNAELPLTVIFLVPLSYIAVYDAKLCFDLQRGKYSRKKAEQREEDKKGLKEPQKFKFTFGSSRIGYFIGGCMAAWLPLMIGYSAALVISLIIVSVPIIPGVSLLQRYLICRILGVSAGDPFCNNISRRKK